MPILTVKQNGITKRIEFEGVMPLDKLLGFENMHVEKPCGGRGVCKKCTVLVNGKKELACRYILTGDAEVILPDTADIVSVTGARETGKVTENTCLCLDIGTTTLALALVSLDNKQVVKTKTAPNPQRSFGADVISRIEYCANHGTAELQTVLLEKIREMTAELFSECGVSSVKRMYAAGNTTMLHLFFGVDCSSLGVSPYTPVFLKERSAAGKELGFGNIGEIVSLPGISAFVGADIVAGLCFVEKPSAGKYSLLIDLGTNAETVLFGEGTFLCATAAAGPCFEGANISSGMSASEGAVYAYGEDGSYSVIGDKEPAGICATGLIDIIAALVKDGTVEESGFMAEDFRLSEKVSVTAADIREFQLAKSAVRSAVECLLRRGGVGYGEVEHIYVAGGFSAKMNVENAAYLGLFQKDLAKKIIAVNNSSLLGTVKYATEGCELTDIVSKAEYLDLGSYGLFTDLFFENMAFEN